VSWVFLSVESVVKIHEEQINLFGGSHGIRDAGLMESAVMRAEFKANFDSEASLGAIVATLGYGLIKNHAFVDGNKRIGLAAVAAMLTLNGHRMTASTDEQIAMVLKTASSEITEADWTAWVERSIAPLKL
jgi:death-on-curing protein